MGLTFALLSKTLLKKQLPKRHPDTREERINGR